MCKCCFPFFLQIFNVSSRRSSSRPQWCCRSSCCWSSRRCKRSDPSWIICSKKAQEQKTRCWDCKQGNNSKSAEWHWCSLCIPPSCMCEWPAQNEIRENCAKNDIRLSFREARQNTSYDWRSVCVYQYPSNIARIGIQNTKYCNLKKYILNEAWFYS